jgi:putative ATP-dependent endonuclease of OLD family
VCSRLSRLFEVQLFPLPVIPELTISKAFMYIQKVTVKNYRNFENLTVCLSPLTLLVGENDAGKSNFLYALSLPLCISSPDYNQKRLAVSDINSVCIRTFYTAVIQQLSDLECINLIPKVSITLQFSDTKDHYELAILSKWLIDNNGVPAYEIQYNFKPKNSLAMLETTKSILQSVKLEDLDTLSFPIELYEYEIISTNNNKDISQADLKHVILSNIGAERDSFADSTAARSNGLLTKILVNSLQDLEKKSINSAYGEFFSAIKKTEIFSKVFKLDDAFENIKNYFDQLHCIPNLPNLRNIIANITLGYGDQFLYQKGLGQRNMVLIFLLFAYYKTTHKSFNVCCIEEPEAHLSVNNLRLTADYISKSAAQAGGLLQTIISTHSPSIINKLNIKNVVVFSGGKAKSLADASQELQDYLSKRPNFDILKLLFSSRTILVEGPTEEMLINSFLQADTTNLSEIEVIAIGQKGYRTFLDIWLHLNKDNPDKKIGVVRDFDDQPNAKKDHDAYDDQHSNITVRTTAGYTLEDDFASHENNCKILAKIFSMPENNSDISAFMKTGKTDWMLDVCNYVATHGKANDLSMPIHIQEIVKAVS